MINKFKHSIIVFSAFALMLLVAYQANATPFQGLVTSVHDGDTITVNNEKGVAEKIRLRRADTPELKSFTWQTQPYAAEARTATLNLCGGKIATINRTSKDKYGRSIADVNCGGIDLATYLIKNGDAWAYRYSSTKATRALQSEAKANSLGLWRLSNPIEPFCWRNKTKCLN